jgi:drug/metabolite transporter (DMT)-like permease
VADSADHDTVLYVILVLASATIAVSVGRRSPRRLITIGLVAVVLGLAAVAVAVVSGNIVLGYIAAMAGLFGFAVLLGCLIDAIAREHNRPQYR